MKAAILILACFAAASCAKIFYTVSSNCLPTVCERNSWNTNSTTYSYACPKSGSRAAAFRQIPTSNQLFLDFTADNTFSSDKKVSIPLISNPSFFVSGIQYYYTFSNGVQFIILNCIISNARLISQLCKSQAPVAGKYINGIFQAGCAFGLNYSDNGFLSEAAPINF